jgi:ParB/RepB/Spo0J family partition protein
MNLSDIGNITKGKVKTTGVSDFVELEISKVYPNPAQPRKSFKDIEELASSIKDKGLIQPIAVVKDGAGKYMIVSGERRYRAITLLAHKTIKAHILKATSKDIEELTLIENIQRDDLTDLEVAKYISMLWSSGQYAKKQDLAKAIGKSASYISKAFSCLKLQPQIIEDLEENKNDVPLSVLEEISRVKDKETQVEVYNKYIDGNIIRDDIKNFKSDQKISPVKKYKEVVVMEAEPVNERLETLSIHLIDGAAVSLKKDTKYKITIEEI